MAKFRSPFSTNTLLVTQTYHTQSNNTAVDFSAVAETPVYALADGQVTYRSSGAGSYCIQQVDNSDLKIYYVHTYKWVGANTQVKKGQVICYVAPSSVNGGYPTHIHLGLQVGKYLMDDMDRNLDIKAGFSWGSKDNIAIRNAWFNGGSVFDWSKHKDLSYLNSAMFKKGDTIIFTGEQNIREGSGTTFPVISIARTGDTGTIIDGPRTANNYTWYDIRFDKGGTGWVADVDKMRIYVKPPTPPEPPGQTECEKEIERLEKEIRALELTTGTLGEEISYLTTLNDDLTKEYDVLKIDLQISEGLHEGLKLQYKQLEEDFEVMREQRDKVISEYNELEKKCGEIQQEESNLKLLINKILQILGLIKE